jgi:thiol-disulfide isomerase/thioredoxin
MLLHFWLPCFSLAIFVPFVLEEYNETRSLPIVNKTQLDVLVSTNAKVVAMGFSPKMHGAKEARDAYDEFSIHFSGDAVFVVFDKSDAKAEAMDHDLKLPSFWVYADGKLLSIYPYIGNENGFVRILELLFHGNELQIAITVSDLYGLIGDINYAILAPTPQLFDHAMKLHFNISERIGEIGVFRVAPSVLSELGLSDDDLALFRNEDLQIVPLKSQHESFDDDIASFAAASTPVYHIFHAADFIDPTKTLIAFTTPKLTLQHRDFLFEIATKYPNLTVGWLRPEFLELAALVQCTFRDRLDLHVCNFARRWWLDVGDVLDPGFLRQPFDRRKWVEKVDLIVGELRHGRTKHYISEPVPRSGSLVQKVVGKTYEEFIADPDSDVVMMYVSSDCRPCREFKDTYLGFVKEYFETGQASIRFGWINVMLNSAAVDYPNFHGFPHFELFPARNKSDHDQLRGPKSRDALVRWLTSRASKPFPLTAPPPDKFQTSMQLINTLINGGGRVPVDEVDKYMQWLAETADSIGIDLGEAPGFEQFANMLPARKAQEIARMRAAEEASAAAKDAELVMSRVKEGM